MPIQNKLLKKIVALPSLTMTIEDLALLSQKGDQRLRDLGITGIRRHSMAPGQERWIIQGFHVEGEDEQLSLDGYPGLDNNLFIATCAATAPFREFIHQLYQGRSGYGTLRFSAIIKLIVKFPHLVRDRKKPLYSFCDEYYDDEKHYRFIIGVKVVDGKFVFCKFDHQTGPESKPTYHSFVGKDVLLYKRPWK
jgi:hypothetical protein